LTVHLERLRRFKISPLLARELKARIEAFEKIVSKKFTQLATL